MAQGFIDASVFVTLVKRLSGETRAKQSAALKAHWAAKRAAQARQPLSMAQSRKENHDPRD